MNMITQAAKKKQAVVKYAIRKGKSEASRKYNVSLSSVKRWCKWVTSIYNAEGVTIVYLASIEIITFP